MKDGRDVRILLQQMLIDRLGGPGSMRCANTKNAIGPSSSMQPAALQRFSMRRRLNEVDRDLEDYGISRRGLFLIRESDFGPTVVLDENLISRTRAFMKRNQIKRLEINQSLGFPGKDVGCVGDFQFITGFEIIHHTVNDISPIHNLVKLENLSIQTYCRTRIEFGHFPRLRHCRLLWRPRGQSIFECAALQSLFLDYFNSKDLGLLCRKPIPGVDMEV